MQKIYFISGVSGVGKTSVMVQLKEVLSPEKYDIHDLDERGVPDGGGLEWLRNETRHWLNIAKKNAGNSKNTIICGFANPKLLENIHKPGKDVPIKLILLHASGDIIKKRLQGRYSTPESVKEIERASGISLEKFIKNNRLFAPKLRTIFKNSNRAIIETDDKTPKEIAEEIIKTLK